MAQARAVPSSAARAAGAFSDSGQLLQSLLRASPLAVICLDADDKVMFWNPAAEEMFGWKAEEVLSQRYPLLSAELEAGFGALKREVLAGRTFTLHETRRMRKDGSLVDVSISGTPLWDAAGNIAGSMAILADISARKRAEKERDRVFELSLDLLCVADFTHFKRVNPAFTRTLGFTAEELLARPFIEFIHPEDRERTRAEAQTLSAGIDTISFENRYVCKDGSYRWLAWNCRAPLPGETTLYASARDVTELKKALETVRTLEGLLPTCAACHRIRDANGTWKEIESYIQEHSRAQFTHGICPECRSRLYPEV